MPPSLIAQKLSIKEEDLNLLCSYFFQHSAQDIINQKRIGFACHEMEKANFQIPSMDELAIQSGFKQTTHFYKAFSSITGVLPQEYWQNLNKNRNN